MNIKVNKQIEGTLAIPRPIDIKSIITEGVAITWDGDTIYLTNTAANKFLIELQEAKEEYISQKVNYI